MSATSTQAWLESVLPFVLEQLPPAPARVLEIGCGPAGGFVPGLTAAGHRAVGVDPEAPAGPRYEQREFEEYDLPRPVDAVVACTALHHVTDLDAAVGRIAEVLAPDGIVVVVEWAPELLDEVTARWVFARRLPAPDGHGTWLDRHRDGWPASGLPWEDYLADWVAGHGMHTGAAVVAALDTRFESRSVARTPYLFADLAGPDGLTEADEQAAIDAGLIRPTGLRYVGRRR